MSVLFNTSTTGGGTVDPVPNPKPKLGTSTPSTLIDPPTDSPSTTGQ